MIFVVPTLVMASELVLKDGRVVDGKIIEKTAKYIKVDIGGGLGIMTYYFDEIDTADGEKIEDQTKHLLEKDRSEQVGRQQQAGSIPESLVSKSTDLPLTAIYKTALEFGYEPEMANKIAEKLLPYYNNWQFRDINDSKSVIEDIKEKD